MVQRRTWWDILRYTSRHDGSMCNAGRSMCDQISYIDRHWWILRNIGMNAWHLIAHWSTLICIAHCSIMSWYMNMSCPFHSQFCSVCLNFPGNPSQIYVVRPRCLPSRICLSELAGFPPGPSHGYLPESSSYLHELSWDINSGWLRWLRWWITIEMTFVIAVENLRDLNKAFQENSGRWARWVI